MTTPLKIWIRERLPSTTRACTLSVSPARKSGMSVRCDRASRASSVFIAASSSAQGGLHRTRPRGWIAGERRNRVAATPLLCHIGGGDLKSTLGKYLSVVFVQRVRGRRRQQVGLARGRPQQRLVPSPPRDPAAVPPAQYLRYRQRPPLRRPAMDARPQQ